VRALLDTHTFLWFNADDPRLSERVRGLISEPEGDMILSAVSAWEIAIKYSRGRLPAMDEPPHLYMPARIASYGFTQMPVELSHAYRVALLPRYHGDPFDRLLIAQAQVEGLPILTSDPNIARYDVEIVW